MKREKRIRIWIIGWAAITVALMAVICVTVYQVDPYFHYHKPDTDTYYYELYNQRSQNDGISKHFDYDAVMTGTSMTENFKTSDIDEVFSVNAIKLPFAGGSYKEINDNLKVALKYNDDLKFIMRGLDTGKFTDEPDKMRFDLGEYPTYLYDNNPFNDVDYLFNKEILLKRIYQMKKERTAYGFEPGIDSFDGYSYWSDSQSYGLKGLMGEGGLDESSFVFAGAGDAVHLTDEERETVRQNITQNVTSLADQYPDVAFYYFFTPYSILWYKDLVESGEIYKQLEAEEYTIELILQHENICLFSFNGIEEVVADLDNYKDITHYGAWINSDMLQWMSCNEYRLTQDNYQDYLDAEYELFLNYDYGSLRRN